MALLVMATTLKDVPISDNTDTILTKQATATGKSKGEIAGGIIDRVVIQSKVANLQNSVREKVEYCYKDIDCVEALDTWLDDQLT